MKTAIQIKLFAGLQAFAPEAAESFEIEPGISIGDLLGQLAIPAEKAHLIFINGVKAELDTTLQGGERVGIFPPVGGG
jgi:molybdopterin converting factor small subunit